MSGWIYVLPHTHNAQTYQGLFIENDPTGHPKPAHLAQISVDGISPVTSQCLAISCTYNRITASHASDAIRQQPGMTRFGNECYPCIEFVELSEVVSLDLERASEFNTQHPQAV